MTQQDPQIAIDPDLIALIKDDAEDIGNETGEQVYDRLMKDIEPELVSDQISLLPEKYKNESVEQGQNRANRYKKAFEEFDKRATEYTNRLVSISRANQRRAMHSIEKFERKEEQSRLNDLEAQIAVV